MFGSGHGNYDGSEKFDEPDASLGRQGSREQGDWDDSATLRASKSRALEKLPPEIGTAQDLRDYGTDTAGGLPSSSTVINGSNPGTSGLKLDIAFGDGRGVATCSVDVAQDATYSFISRDLSRRLRLALIPWRPGDAPAFKIPGYGIARMNDFVEVHIRAPIYVSLYIGVLEMDEIRGERLVLGSRAVQKLSRAGLVTPHQIRRVPIATIISDMCDMPSKSVDEVSRSSASQSLVLPGEASNSRGLYLTSNVDELVTDSETSVLHDTRAVKDRILSLLSELDHCTPLQWTLDEVVGTSWRDRAKLALETLSGCHWDWWPLAAPLRPLESDQIRLVWTCCCGDIRSENVSTMLGQKLIRLLNEQRISRGVHGISDPPNARDGAPVVPVDTLAGQEAFFGNQVTPTSMPQESLNNAGNSGRARPNNHDEQSRENFIFLMVTSSFLQLSQIKSTTQCTRTFAAHLQDGYRQLRGFWRFWFSVYVFSHCDFFEFEKFATSSFMDIGEGLPPEAIVPEYFYYPRPAQGPRPISPKDFQHIYYHHRQDSSIADNNSNKPFDSITNQFLSRLRLSRAWIPALKRRYRGPLPADTVSRIPKRCRRFDELSNVRERFWGLHAREAVSAMRVMIYVFVSIASYFAFCLWYLVGFGGEVIDLQNATVPLIIALTMVNLLCVWIAKD